MPRVNVVVPVYNKRPLLPQAIDSILAATARHGAADVCLVDNGSTDGSFQFITSEYRLRARIVRAPSHLSIAAVRNLGAREGNAPLLSFFDCDCLIPLDYFAHLEDVFQVIPGAVIAGCKIALPKEPTWVERTWNDMHDDRGNGERTYINSANLAIRRQAFAAVGGFKESLETGEDAELCQRVRHAGGLVYQDQRLAVIHLDNAKTLGAFFRKERWRGLGMLGTVSRRLIDKPTAMTLLYLGSLLIAAWLLARQPLGFGPSIVLSVALIAAVPVATVAYRQRASAHRLRVVEGALLYAIYYLARLNALMLLAWRGVRSRIRKAIVAGADTPAGR